MNFSPKKWGEWETRLPLSKKEGGRRSPPPRLRPTTRGGGGLSVWGRVDATCVIVSLLSHLRHTLVVAYLYIGQDAFV